MYPTSNAYKQAIAGRVVMSDWFGTITTTAGNEIEFSRENLNQNQSKLTRQYASGDTLEIGNAYSSQLTLGLRGEYDKYQFYGAVIELTFRLHLTSSTYEDVPCGTFVVADAEFQYNSVKLTAYDYMQSFAGKISALTDATPYDALDAICTACGVDLGSTQADIEAMVNGTATLKLSALENTETYRNVIGYIAAIVCANAVIGVDGELYLKQYSNNYVRNLGVSDRYSSTYIDYIGRYTTLALIDGDGNEQTYTASGSYSETLLTMSIGTNPILNAMEDKDDMAQDIIDELSTIVYAPCTITTTQDPSLDIGDTLRISGGNIENPVNIIITKQDIKLYGQTQIVSAGGNYELTEAKTKTEAVVQQVPQKIAQTEQKLEQEIKQITYDYVLPQVTRTDPIYSGGDAIVLEFYFTLEAAAIVRFGSTINFEVYCEDPEYELVHLHVIYNVDNTPLNPDNPLMQYYDSGYHILTLDFLTEELQPGSHTFGVAFGVTGGDIY